MDKDQIIQNLQEANKLFGELLNAQTKHSKAGWGYVKVLQEEVEALKNVIRKMREP